MSTRLGAWTLTAERSEKKNPSRMTLRFLAQAIVSLKLSFANLGTLRSRGVSSELYRGHTGVRCLPDMQANQQIDRGPPTTLGFYIF